MSIQLMSHISGTEACAWRYIDGAEGSSWRGLSEAFYAISTTHRPIALKGRVPVNVVCPVAMGDYLIPSSMPGHAEPLPEDATARDLLRVFATSLGTCTNGTSTIEAWVR